MANARKLVPSTVVLLVRHGVTRMIHGHTHRPARHVSVVDGTPRERLVLADWEDRGHYLEVDANGARAREISG